MKKIYITLCLALLGLIPNMTKAQTLEVDKDFKKNRQAASLKPAPASLAPAGLTPEKCGYNYVMNKARARGFNDAVFESEISRIIEKKKAEGHGRFIGPVTIPVIFHVIYRTADAPGNSSANLASAKFQAQIDQLNLDYSNLSGSAYGVSADVQIRFCMALVDTAGRPLPEAGIERINGQTRTPAFSNTNTMSLATLESYFENTIKPATIWDPTSYFNVWTASMNNSGLLGYATFPGLSTLPGLDAGETNSNAGVVIAWQTVGSVANPGTSVPYGYGRTLTHEAGHFFGLRHIWGDDNCGNDYCNDTPPQDQETTGCPAPGTLNNCTPSQPKMFENYMDYSNDACLNTFTANQAARSQTVMDNSPRRLSLITSKACQARAGNAISFIYGGEYSASETGVAGACPNSRTYAFRLYPSVQASGAATVNFNTTGSTAAVNKDFTISPASVTFAAGETAPKTIFVTIMDDQETEATEKIVIGYGISGAGVVAGPDKQTIVINILDDETGIVVVDNTNPTRTLLTENFNASVNFPAGWQKEIYGDGITTPNEWVVSANGGSTLTTNCAHITQNTATKPNTYNNTSISDAYLFTPLIDASGLKDLNLSFTWRCLGETGFDEGYLGFVPEGQTPTAANVQFFNLSLVGQTAAVNSSLNLPSSMAGKKFYFVFNWFNDETVGTSPGLTIDNIVFTGKANAIATTSDADTSFPVYATNRIDFYSKPTVAPVDSRIIATINNPNADLGCITASIPVQGNGITVLTTTAGAFARSNKVIQLTPSTANTTASYQATFYFTTAELAAWGVDAPNLKLMKVSDAVDVFGTVSAGQIVTATFNDQRSTLGYASYTGNFTGGFSKFMLVSPTTALPVTTFSFEARPNGKNIQLSWTTATEYNNKGFVIERSTDGTHFETIGWKDGAGNSSLVKNYDYTDNFVQPDQLYYYRLRQTDIDSRETLSAIRQARIGVKAVISVNISPNPASSYVKIFTAGTAGLSNVNLLDTKGSLIQSWKQLNCSAAPQNLDISKIASGIYIIQVITGDAISTQKLIID